MKKKLHLTRDTLRNLQALDASYTYYVQGGMAVASGQGGGQIPIPPLPTPRQYAQETAFAYGCHATYFAPCLNHTVQCQSEGLRVITERLLSIPVKVDPNLLQ